MVMRTVRIFGGLLLVGGGVLTMLAAALLTDGMWGWWGAGSVTKSYEDERRGYVYFFGLASLMVALPIVLGGLGLGRPTLFRRFWVWLLLATVYLGPLLLTFLSLAFLERGR